MEQVQPIGFLANLICGKQLPLQVLQSNAGFYIGTFDDKQGFNCSRESVQYWPTETSANEALKSGAWTQKMDA